VGWTRTHTCQLSEKVLVHPPSSYGIVSLVGAQLHCARTRTAHTRFCSANITPHAHPCTFGRRPSPHAPAHTRILAGGHRSSVELRPSRNPSLKSSKMMPSWGITPHPQRGHFGDVPPMLRSCLTSSLLFSIERHEFVGNPGEREARAHLRGQAPLHGACQRYAFVVKLKIY